MNLQKLIKTLIQRPTPGKNSRLFPEIRSQSESTSKRELTFNMTFHYQNKQKNNVNQQKILKHDGILEYNLRFTQG